MNNKISNKTRNSSIESLRIISMLFITFWHVTNHGIVNKIEIPQATENILAIINSFCIVHVNIFILISGYFSLNFSLLKIRNFYFLITYYSILCIIFGIILKESISETYILSSVFSLSRSSWWFIKIYIYLWIISPFLNQFLSSLDKRKFIELIICLSVLNLYFGFIQQGTFNLNGYNIEHFIYMYTIGYFLKKNYFNNYINIKGIYYLLLYFLCGCLLILVRYLGHNIGFGQNINLIAYNNPLIVLESIFFFLFFTKIKISSTLINFTAKSALAVYLIHDYPLIRKHLTDIYLYLSPFNSIVINSIATTCIIFICCLLIDFLRRIIIIIIQKLYNDVKNSNFNFFKSM